MSFTLKISIVLIGGLIIGLIAVFSLKPQGYSPLRSFVTGFLAGTGILGVIVKIVSDYI
ncbi:MAG: hypothetical protein ABJG68_06630 [Crocinitomicaceae bacterium]